MKCPKCNGRSVVRLNKEIAYRQCKKCVHRFTMEDVKEVHLHYWSDEEEEQLRAYKEKGLGNIAIGKKMKRGRSAVSNKWHDMLVRGKVCQ